MTIFRRMQDILSANLNDLVDQFENPEQMLRQAIREMEAALGRALERAAQVIATQKLLARQRDDQLQREAQWRSRAETAVGRKNDELARTALRRAREHQALASALDEQHAAAEETARKLRRQIDTMRVRLSDARLKFESLAARVHAAEASQQMFATGQAFDNGSAASQRFQRLSERLERREATAEAWMELHSEAAADEQADEIDDTDIELELARIKQMAGDAAK
jgi:phage shock protein A